MTIKKKILFCMETLTGGGAEKNLIEVLKRIDKEHYEIDLLLLRKEGVYLNDIPNHVTWYSLGEDKGRLSQNFDIEIAFMEGYPTKYIAYRDSSAIKIAWVRIDLLTMHWTKYVYSGKKEEEWCYTKFNKILFVSHQAKDQFNKLFPSINIQQHVTYNIIDAKEISLKSEEYPVEKSKLTLCSIGRLVPQKGYIQLIHTLNQLSKEGFDFECWILGDGYQRPMLEKLIKSFSLDKKILLKGFFKNPFPFVKSADIFISSSIAEGYSLVVAEAICLHKAIISTATAGPTELLGNGEYGLLIDNNQQTLYTGLKELIQNENLRTFYQDKSRERSKIFNPKKKITEILEMIEDNK